MTRRAIFITGGGSGIGRATARLFAERGWFVGIGDIDEAAMAAVLTELPGGWSYAHRLDVRDVAQWEGALAAFSVAAGGRIDVVMNNAGIATSGPLLTMSDDEIDRTLAINLRGVIHGARAAYPHLKASAPGSVLLNTASAAAIYGGAGMSIYSITKFGVRALTEALDVEWQGDGIRVADLMPSFIDTPLLDTLSGGSNQPIRDRVRAAGLELTPVEQVAEAAWQAVHGTRLHTLVGRTARKLAFAARWMPGKLRQRGRKLADS